MRKAGWCIAFLITALIFWAPMVSVGKNANSEDSIEPDQNAEKNLAEAAQNPVADMISLPFQNNANFGFGPNDDVRNVLNIQPVFPFQLRKEQLKIIAYIFG